MNEFNIKVMVLVLFGCFFKICMYTLPLSIFFSLPPRKLVPQLDVKGIVTVFVDGLINNNEIIVKNISNAGLMQNLIPYLSPKWPKLLPYF